MTVNGATVRLVRESMGLSLSSFSHLVGVEVRTICRWERVPLSDVGASETVVRILRRLAELPANRREYVSAVFETRGWLHAWCALFEAP
jgi:predicted transcriptional regulator